MARQGRKVLALVLVLGLLGGALATQQQRLYHRDQVEEQLLVQQHSVFVELITEEQSRSRHISSYAAVVGLVKSCKEVRTIFDNAVLWFNDQFLFGNKSATSGNRTNPADAMGYQPNGTISHQDLNDTNRDGGWSQYNASTHQYEANTSRAPYNGSPTDDPPRGGNPDRDGFIKARADANGTFGQRWGGCHVPNGFLFAIEPNAPNGNGDAWWWPQKAPENSSQARLYEGLGVEQPPSNGVEALKMMIEMDNDCNGCIFSYAGTFYVTDPNNHRWMVDKLNYRLGFIRGLTYVVHLQVDPWSPTRQGFPDEAIWSYEDGTVRLGMPYTEDPDHPCKTEAQVHDRGYGYDELPREGGSNASMDPRRGPSGTWVECAIEYNFLLAVSLGDFDRAGSVEHGHGGAEQEDEAWEGNSHPHNPTICHRYTKPWHPDHPDPPQDPQPNGTRCEPRPPPPSGNATGNGTANGTENDSFQHDHSAVTMDLFYFDLAPHFIMSNPYWDHALDPANRTAGTPPVVTDDCRDVLPPYQPHQRSAVQARSPMVCDVTAMDGYHFHDGFQTIP